jgi:hypothetical protein
MKWIPNSRSPQNAANRDNSGRDRQADRILRKNRQPGAWRHVGDFSALAIENARVADGLVEKIWVPHTPVLRVRV